jgi:hypothetical protein
MLSYEPLIHFIPNTMQIKDNKYFVWKTLWAENESVRKNEKRA